jgi:Short C-terminal domain
MPGLLRGVARTAVVAGTATAVSGRVSRRQQGRWAANDQAAQDQAATEQAPAAPEAPPPPPPAPIQDAEPPTVTDTGDMLSQLQQLGELRDSGVLTEAEFDAQKSKILPE